MTPRFIVFEGIDGSGKSTQARLFVASLAARDITAIELAEPTSGPYGQLARQTASTEADLSRQRELFTLDRQDHVKRKIEPLLRFVRERPGFMLVQSRYYLSAPAYQASGCDVEELKRLLDEQREFAPAPDLVIVLDLPVESALQRITKRGQSDLYETHSRLQDVRRRYLALKDLDSAPQAWIDASGTVDEVQNEVQRVVFGRVSQ